MLVQQGETASSPTCCGETGFDSFLFFFYTFNNTHTYTHFTLVTGLVNVFFIPVKRSQIQQL